MTEDEMQTMLAYEAYIRRAAAVGMPFMLKGSYVTRQYFSDPARRMPNDMDWVYLEPLSDVKEAGDVFTRWATAVTEAGVSDGVSYDSFAEDAFWRRIDYAMADDFPTVNTYLRCRVDDGLLQTLNLDISFNLDVEVPPEPLLYRPLRGEPFLIPYTVPLSLQVSWKIHQTLVRPRFKDLFDLIELLQHPSWNETMLQQSLQALVNECVADRIDIKRLEPLLQGTLKPYFTTGSMADTWAYWRHETLSNSRTAINDYNDQAHVITDADTLPQTLPEFMQQLLTAFQRAGWVPQLL